MAHSDKTDKVLAVNNCNLQQLQCLCFCLKSNSVHLLASQPAGRLPCIWKCPSYEPAVQG